MQKNAWTYSMAGAVLGTFGLLLRWLQCEIIFDETGLPVKSAPQPRCDSVKRDRPRP